MGSRFSIEAERDSLKAQVDAFKVRCDALTIQRDAAEALARSNSDPAHARALADATADRLFVEGERDAALHDLAIARDHLEAANNAHREAEEELEKFKCLNIQNGEVSARTVQGFQWDIMNANARDDAAQQMVAECKAAIQDMFDKAPSETPSDSEWKTAAVASMALRKLLTTAAPVAGRWCLASERDEANKRAEHEHNEMQAQAKLAVDWMCDAHAVDKRRDDALEEAANAVGALELVQGDGDFDQLHEVTRGAVTDFLAVCARKLVGGGE